MKRIISILASVMIAVCALAQGQFYVVMRDGSVEAYPVDKVDSMTFKTPDVAKVGGLTELLERVDALKTEVDYLRRKVAACCGASEHEFVDLGLPSGTLWATMNIGAETIEGYGNYYAWGETEKKSVYNAETYSLFNLADTVLMRLGVIDGKGGLTANYDAATANWGADWCMPTKEQMEELLTLEHEWGAVNGVAGCTFKGTNGNEMFMPTAGYAYTSGQTYNEEYCTYWSASSSEKFGNYLWGGEKLKFSVPPTNDNSNGMPVRAVMKK